MMLLDVKSLDCLWERAYRCAQAVRYNSVVGARYVLLTNGRRHLCFEWDARAGRYAPLGNFPDLSVFFWIE